MRSLATALLVLVLAACAAARGLTSPDASLAGARAEWKDGSLAVVVTPGGEAPRAITSAHLDRGVNSARLYTLDGDTGVEWNTFVYGAAAPGVARVEIDRPGAVGGEVIDGAWLITLRDKGLAPDDLHWRFLDPSGTVLASGTGVFPPEA